MSVELGGQVPSGTSGADESVGPKPQGASTSSVGKECRICLTTDNQHDIVEPCSCHGSVQYAHMECLRSWCVENLSLKCEICGNVYKDNVVDALMSTLIEAQDRQVAAQGLSDDYGIRLDVLDAAARNRDSPNAAQHARPAQANADDQNSEEAQQRMQAFLEELLQLYASRSEAMLARHNRSRAFQPEPAAPQPRRATATYSCAAALLLMWMLLFVILSRVFDSDYITGATAAFGALVLVIFAAVYFRGRRLSEAAAQAHAVPFGRAAREAQRARALRDAQAVMTQPPVIRIIR